MDELGDQERRVLVGRGPCDGSISGQGAGQLIQAQFAAWAAEQQPGVTVLE